MATIQNDRDVLLQAAATRLETVTLPSSINVDFANVNGGTKPSNNADVTVTTINGGLVVTGGGITFSGGGALKGGQTAWNTGTGFFIGNQSGVYALSIGNPAGHKFTWDGSNINITGALTLTNLLPVASVSGLAATATSSDFSAVTGTTKPSNNADVTLAAINGSLAVTGGGITFTGGGAIKGGQTAYNTGTGFFLGYSGGNYVLSLGNPAGHSLTWNGSVLSLGGGTNLDITGQARVNGTVSVGGRSFAFVANDALTGGSQGGVYGKGNGTSSGYGTYGEDAGVGVGAYGIGGVGVVGESNVSSGAAGVGGLFNNTHGGVGLWLNTGTFKWGSTYTYAQPAGTGTHALGDDGTWLDLSDDIQYSSAGGAPGGAPTGSITVTKRSGGSIVLATY